MHKTSGPPISTKFANLSLVCAVLVVAIHIGLTDSPHRFGWLMKEIVAEGIARIAVPFFFVCSGYFLAKHYLEAENVLKVAKVQIVKRIKTLLIPFWVWGFLYLPCLIGTSIVSDLVAGRSVRIVPWGSLFLRASGLDVIHNPVLEPLWFVRVLFVLVVLSPVIVTAIRKLGIVWPILEYAFYICFEVFGVGLPSVFYDGKGLAFFSIGLYLAMRNGKLPLMWSGSKMAWSLGAVSFGLLLWFRWTQLPFPILPFVIPGMLLWAWHFIPCSPWPQWLTSLSFPIYLLHCFMLLPVQYAWHLTAWMDKGCEFVFRWVVVVIGSSLIALALRKITPRAAAWMFGGR